MPEELPLDEAALRTMAENVSDDHEEEAPPEPPAEEVESTEDSSSETAPEAKAEEPPKQESDFAKAKREKETREAKAWKEINAAKAEVEKAKAEMENAKQETIRQQREAQEKAPLRDKDGFTAADYHNFALEQLERAKGINDPAARAAAVELARKAFATRDEMQGHEQGRYREIAQTKFLEGVEKVTEKRPEFKYNSGVPPMGQTAEVQAICQILKEHPALSTTPNGFQTAVAIYDAQRDSSALPELKKQLEKANAENKRLNSLTSLPGGSPTRKGGAPGELSERDLRRQAQEMDAMH